MKKKIQTLQKPGYRIGVCRLSLWTKQWNLCVVGLHHESKFKEENKKINLYMLVECVWCMRFYYGCLCFGVGALDGKTR